MRAVLYERYGPPEVLRLAEVEEPVPGDDDVLVGVRAANVTRGDCAWRGGRSPFTRLFHGLLRPKIEATKYVETGQKTGNVVLTVS